jgi:hypothetical protein
MIFRIIPADTFIWNLSELVDFLIEHQNQDIIITNGTEGCCARTIGLYQWLDKFSFNSVTIETGNILESHDRYKISYKMSWKFFEVERPIEQQLHTWNQKSVFGTVYGRPIWHRLGIVSHLLSVHPDISEIGCLGDATHPDKRKQFEIAELWEHDADSLVKFAQISSGFPYKHTDVDPYAPASTLTDGYVKQTEKIYKNFLIDIVSETFTSGDCFFATDKTIRPMLLKKPFIIFASKHHLAYLTQMGFKTFQEFWNEGYDNADGVNRYQQILQLIDWIAQQPMDALVDMYQRMAPILDHNYNLLMRQHYDTTITKIQ